MERRTVLGGIAAASASALTPATLTQFALGESSNVAPKAVDFEASHIKTKDNTIFIRRYAQGSALLMVHGFPRTSLIYVGVMLRLGLLRTTR
jgi:haloacetate dehalogenase